MKSLKQPQKMESKPLSQIKSIPNKTMGTGNTHSNENKVHSSVNKNHFRKTEYSRKKYTSKSRRDKNSFVSKHIARFVTDSKDPSSVSSTSLQLAGSLLSLNTSFPVRLAQTVTLTSDSGGVVAFSMFADPSSSGQNFPEYSTWTTLFNQVRVKTFRITIAPVSNNTALSLNYPGMIAGCLTTLGVPTSMTSVSENADSKLYAWEVEVHPMIHSIKYSPRPVWADITTPDPGDNIGCPGCIIGYFEGLSVSTDSFRMLVEGIYEFRSRT